MAGRMSRNKGARGEREIIAYLQPIVDKVCAEAGVPSIRVQRNLLQAHSGGHDIHGLEWLAMEVKRQEKENVPGWWRQTLRQCLPTQTPVLVYRANHQPWAVRMRAGLRVGKRTVNCVVTTDLPTFLVYFEQRVRQELGV